VRDDLERIEREFDEALSAAQGHSAEVEAARVRFLGRKGELPALMKRLGALGPEARPEAGKAINELKERIHAALESASALAETARRREALAREAADITLPSRVPWSGSLHPVTHTRRELERVFRELGYTIESGPEVEDDFHNFEALNLPPDHPARDATDTFYVEGGLLLRTHTSPVQIRTMEERKPPIRMVCPGRVYRRDLDATHLPMFHQLEALVVDEGVSMADLKGTVAEVWKRFFGGEVRTRLRPGYFPFVEPGCEYDISCQVCGGSGCRACKGSGWLELGGAGMVHPAVFEAVGIDSDRYTGFAFGLGIDRIAMMRYGIDDLRLLMENDVRFLAQFPV
jgi:phenylalanyl-tRNA synthetase alpha chain